MKTLADYRVTLMAAITMICVSLSTAIAQTTKPTTQPQTSMEHWKTLKWSDSQQGREIDLSQFKRTFNDDFRKMDIVKDNSTPGPKAVWFSPGHDAFKTNSPLRADGPFKLVDDGLRVRVEKVGNRWLGACMQTVNTKGHGFAQQYGYFEMTGSYSYPGPGKGLWGGFWLKSQCDYFNNGATTRTEIDIDEFYGDNAYHASVHLWPAASLPDATITKHVWAGTLKQGVARHLFDKLKIDGVVKGFHSYGGEITPEWVIIYFDRKELGRFPMVDEWKTPLYMLVDSDPETNQAGASSRADGFDRQERQRLSARKAVQGSMTPSATGVSVHSLETDGDGGGFRDEILHCGESLDENLLRPLIKMVSPMFGICPEEQIIAAFRDSETEMSACGYGDFQGGGRGDFAKCPKNLAKRPLLFWRL